MREAPATVHTTNTVSQDDMINLRSATAVEYAFAVEAFDELNPDQQTALSYWKSLCREGNVPSWSDFELVRLPPGLLQTTHVIDVSSETEEIVFRFWGTKLAAFLGVEMMGQPLERIHGSKSYVATAHRELCAAAVNNDPRVVIATISSASEETSFQRTLRLPLRGDTLDLRHCVSLVDFLMDDAVSTSVYNTME